MVNPFKAVSLTEHEALKERFATLERELADSQREVSGLRIELKREVENAERLTALAARAVLSVQVLQQTLTERQLGAEKDRQPGLVLVVDSLSPVPKKQRGFVPLQKRRRRAARREEEKQLRRNALPTLTAQLPEIPLTDADTAAMSSVLAELKEN